MTAAERRALLGDEVIAHINQVAAAAPAPTPELLERLRPILTRPAGRAVRPAAASAA